MILVLTGFHPVPFDRLISAMDEIAGQIKEEVVIQRGESRIGIKNARSMKYAGFKENEELIKSARIVISHAGVGTILDCRRLDKQLIIIPRRMELGESYDDHQFEIAKRAAADGLIKSIVETDGLLNLIETWNHEIQPMNGIKKKDLIEKLKSVIRNLHNEVS